MMLIPLCRAEHFFMFQLDIYTYIFGKRPIHIFCPFSNWVVFQLLSFESSLYILDINPFQTCDLQIFSLTM